MQPSGARPTLDGAGLSFDEALAEVRRLGLREIAGAQEESGGLVDFASSPDLGLVAGGAGGGGGFTLPDPGVPPMGSDYGPGENPYMIDSRGDGGGGGSGLRDFAGKVVGGLGDEISKSPLKSFSTALGIGGMGMGLINQGRVADQMKSNEKFIKESQQRASAAAAPAVAAGTADVGRAEAGRLQPAQEAAIEKWVRERKADVQGRFASMGQGNSTQLQSALAQIDELATVARGQLLQGEEQTGLSALQTGVSAAQAGAQTAQAQQQQLMQILAGLDQQLGKMAGAG